MSDIMRPVPFRELVKRISEEERLHNSIFSISKEQFCIPSGEVTIFSHKIKSAFGPAAGPHTQLCQNIVSAFLTGSRFIELKTVQIMDNLEIEKPCIDVHDEGYNVEWSTEYTLEKAYDEYVKAYVICHMLDARNGSAEPSFMFNMSVGYNLKGIKEERMQLFIDGMIDASRRDNLSRHIEEARELIEEGYLIEGDQEAKERILSRLDEISPNISPIVTVSTMHGCPPDEIEAICRYLIGEKKLDLFVKLNPTLLGYDEVRSTLDSLGFDYIVLNRDSFEHDLKYDDAVSMIGRLKSFAKEEGRNFGVKLTNTLGNVNPKDILPGDERYLSGRALLPISTKVALKLASEFDGDLAISYSGGASDAVAEGILKSGIAPITIATDMLKPGGYTRMSSIVSHFDKRYKVGKVDLKRLKRLIDEVNDPNGVASKDYRGTYTSKVKSKLPLFDCYVAPCMEACPIHQDIPDYIELASLGRTDEALDLIYSRNALPNITGWICDHQCQNHCTRLDYEGPVKIREVKRLIAEKEGSRYIKETRENLEKSSDIKAAVIGGGPAGLSAAYFLALSGFETHLFEKERELGGVVMSTIPDFRIPKEAVKRDVELIEALGVKFHLGSETNIKTLKKEGYRYIFIAIGAASSSTLEITGNGLRESAIEFLRLSKSEGSQNIGKYPVIVGGGNTAMDAARQAVRTKGVKKVRVVYRRSREEMPADIEEYREALKDKVEFLFLHNPVDFTDGKLTLSLMRLSDKDQSGRRKPVDSGERSTIECTALITAIGEKVDSAVLEALSYDENDKSVFIIGDALTGPSTVVRCIESARESVDRALDDFFEGLELSGEEEEHHHHDDGECDCEEEHDPIDDMSDDELRAAEDKFFNSIREKKSRILRSEYGDEKSEYDLFFQREGNRCLECLYLCNKCAEVCPNRANVPIDTREGDADFDNPYQIVHLDAYCNECGNCKTFCSHEGSPYKDKFTLFSRLDDFNSSDNQGFFLEDGVLHLRLDGKVRTVTIDDEGNLSEEIPLEVESLLNTIFRDYDYLLGEVEE